MWIPPQRDRGVPWAREVSDIMAGQPKTGRVPTGGWRSYGAVPSNTYASGGPILGTPYWSGMGAVGSTMDAQHEKSFAQPALRFGAGATADPCPDGYVLSAAGT